MLKKLLTMLLPLLLMSVLWGSYAKAKEPEIEKEDVFKTKYDAIVPIGKKNSDGVYAELKHKESDVIVTVYAKSGKPIGIVKSNQDKFKKRYGSLEPKKVHMLGNAYVEVRDIVLDKQTNNKGQEKKKIKTMIKLKKIDDIELTKNEIDVKDNDVKIETGAKDGTRLTDSVEVNTQEKRTKIRIKIKSNKIKITNVNINNYDAIEVRYNYEKVFK